MRTTIKIRGGLGDSGGYVYAGCFAHGVSEYAPAFPPYWSDAHIPRTAAPVRFRPKCRECGDTFRPDFPTQLDCSPYCYAVFSGLTLEEN